MRPWNVLHCIDLSLQIIIIYESSSFEIITIHFAAPSL